MTTPLEALAAGADEIADDQRRVARTARSMQRRREAGWAWTKILDAERGPGLVELMRRSGQRLRQETGQFVVLLTEQLTREGESRRQIARRLGVTHQRVSAVLDQRRAGGDRS